MNWLIRQATIIDPSSPHHRQTLDIRIADGAIEAVGAELSAEGARLIEAESLYVSGGWLDIGVQTGDPGFEQRETLDSVSAAAARGGFTAIACQPNTDPVVHSKSEVAYLVNHTRDNLVACLPLGAVSRNCEGRDITEMLDMRAAGAVAFTDGEKPVQHNGLLLRALLYAKAFDGLIINRPHDDSIAGAGQIHEGLMSTSLGMKGIPALAEEIMARRDIYLLEYSDSRLHLANVSAAGTVALIRRAKERGLRLTASVPVMNLLFDDEALRDFDANYKVMPPLRSAADREALLAGLADGAIDCISTNHVPWDEEQKKKEFSYAEFGAIGLETAFPALCTYLGDRFAPEQWAEWLGYGPRRLLGRSLPPIEAGQPADLTVFSTQGSTMIESKALRSRSRNTPLAGETLRGRVWAVFGRRQSEFFPLP